MTTLERDWPLKRVSVMPAENCLIRLLLLTAALPLAACTPTLLEQLDAAFAHVTPIVLDTCEELGSYYSAGDLETAFGTPLARAHVTTGSQSTRKRPGRRAA